MASHYSLSEITNQIPELKIVKCFNISLVSKLLFLVQLPPKSINRSHVQHLVRVNFPGIAAGQHIWLVTNGNLSAEISICGIVSWV